MSLDRSKKTASGPETLSPDRILSLADLARIHITEKEADSLAGDLNAVLDLISSLHSIETGSAEVLTDLLEEKNVMRKDEVRASLSHRETMKNAPDEVEGFFRVPRIIEQD